MSTQVDTRSRQNGGDRAFILGGDGVIGRALAEHLSARGGDVVGSTRRANPDGRPVIDLGAPLDEHVLPASAHVAYLLAAVTSMAACEADPRGTRRLNVDAVTAVGDVLRRRGAHLVLVSTNLVHDGRAPFAPAEASPRPQNEYAAQKADLERRLLADGGVAVLRITKVAESLEGLIRQWVAALEKRETIRPFRDLVCAPLPLGYVVEALSRIGAARAEGIFQVGAAPDLAYPDIAAMVARRMGADERLIEPLMSSDAGVKLAAAPAHTTLETAPSEAMLGLPPVDGRAAVEAVIARVLGDD